MGEFLQTANGLVALITALFGLIGTGIGAFIAIKTLINARKEKTHQENWNFIMTIAKAAMSEVEKSTLKGAAKKEAVVNAVKEGCKAAGIDLDQFIDQLLAFIDQSIAFANTIK